MPDILYSTIEEWQEEKEWGNVLDAGTGEQSLQWLLTKQTKSITAITGDPHRKDALSKRFQKNLRPQDKILHGNWLNQKLLYGLQFDLVVADYLLGAIEGFAPYYQNKLFHRLKPHVEGVVYVVGLNPFTGDNNDEGAKLIRKIAELRDACILLAGHRPYREYPRKWTEDRLKCSGFKIIRSSSFPILFGQRFINGQLNVCRRKLAFIDDHALTQSLENHIKQLREHAEAFVTKNGRIRFGSDYIIKAKA